MLYHAETVKANIRNRDGKRVFFLGDRDTLTPSARDWLQQQRIEIRPAREAKIPQYRLSSGEIFKEKPEYLTHLRGDILVPKSHPIIEFRGKMDTFQSELLLVQRSVGEKLCSDLEQILTLSRNILRWEVMEEAAQWDSLCGLTPEQQRSHSHFPQDFYGQPHFMPTCKDSPTILQLNRLRCAARSAELSAAKAFEAESGQCSRPDLLRLLNRMSSMLYILMIREKAKQNRGDNDG